MLTIHEDLGWNQYGRLSEYLVTGYWKPPCVVWLCASRRQEVATVTAALNGLAGRHSALRCHYTSDGGVGVRYHDDPDWPVLVDEAEEIARSHEENLGATFDPFGQQLKRAVVVRGSASTQIGIAVDHSICDGWSLDLIVSELIHRLDGGAVDSGSDVRRFYWSEKARLGSPDGVAALDAGRAMVCGLNGPYPTPPGLFAELPAAHGGATADVERMTVLASADVQRTRVNAFRQAQEFSVGLAHLILEDSAFLMPFHRRRTEKDRMTVGYLASKVIVPCPASTETSNRDRLGAVVSAFTRGSVPHECLVVSYRRSNGQHAVPTPHVTFNHVDQPNDTHPGWRVREPAPVSTARHNVGLHVTAGATTATALWTRALVPAGDVAGLLGRVVPVAADSEAMEVRS